MATSPEYAVLPVGTLVKFGKPGDSVEQMKTLINCKALGATGLTGSFVDCTTLMDTNKQFISDMPEGPEKSLGFIDDPANENFVSFLNAAEKRETVQFYIALPNKRTATMVLALSGWEMNDINAPANEVIQMTVKGKQNNLVWGIADIKTGVTQ
ncbi:phage tail protein [Xenorhabdus budapestensis]|uniref:Phage tail protein n=1 Tax=Xenorhabdus budapestensis TaxID=290110 RepID=A0ABX7VPE0_XENBU|nr:phage tail protein [Xenorhabdus budapestensis]QTL40638.1 phage tail protein [Xenorhabdus budapestensis]